MARRIGFLFIALTLLAAACSGGSAESTVTAGDTASSPDDPSESTDENESEGAEEAEAEPAGSAVENGATSMAASSPIGAFFDEDGGFEAAIAEYTIKVEEEIVKCMAAQGFEFAVTGNGGGFNEVQELQSEMTEREWTTEYGYGISTSFDSLIASQGDDPNAEIVFSMTATEREIWLETLTGGSFGGIQDENTPLEDQGCVGQALIDTGGQDAIEGMESLGMVYEEKEAAIFDEREMVNAVDGWTRCMSEAGYTGYGKIDEPEDDISTRFAELTAPMSSAFEEMTPEEGQSLLSGESNDIGDLPGLDVDALRAIQTEEIKLALADLDCYEAEVKAIFEPLRDALQNGLIDEFSDELNAIKNIGS